MLKNVWSVTGKLLRNEKKAGPPNKLFLFSTVKAAYSLVVLCSSQSSASFKSSLFSRTFGHLNRLAGAEQADQPLGGKESRKASAKASEQQQTQGTLNPHPPHSSHTSSVSSHSPTSLPFHSNHQSNQSPGERAQDYVFGPTNSCGEHSVAGLACSTVGCYAAMPLMYRRRESEEQCLITLRLMMSTVYNACFLQHM